MLSTGQALSHIRFIVYVLHGRSLAATLLLFTFYLLRFSISRHVPLLTRSRDQRFLILSLSKDLEPVNELTN